jgi:hypothetical protein
MLGRALSILSCHVTEHPSSVSGRNFRRRQRDDFRNFIRVRLAERASERGIAANRGFKNRQNFRGRLNRPLPAVNRFHARHKIHTRCELPFHHGRANLSRLLGIWEAAKDQQHIAHVSL